MQITKRLCLVLRVGTLAVVALGESACRTPKATLDSTSCHLVIEKSAGDPVSVRTDRSSFASPNMFFSEALTIAAGSDRVDLPLVPSGSLSGPITKLAVSIGDDPAITVPLTCSDLGWSIGADQTAHDEAPPDSQRFRVGGGSWIRLGAGIRVQVPRHSTVTIAGRAFAPDDAGYLALDTGALLLVPSTSLADLSRPSTIHVPVTADPAKGEAVVLPKRSGVIDLELQGKALPIAIAALKSVRGNEPHLAIGRADGTKPPGVLVVDDDDKLHPLNQGAHDTLDAFGWVAFVTRTTFTVRCPGTYVAKDGTRVSLSHKGSEDAWTIYDLATGKVKSTKTFRAQAPSCSDSVMADVTRFTDQATGTTVEETPVATATVDAWLIQETK